jgi:hypothetical protein
LQILFSGILYAMHNTGFGVYANARVAGLRRVFCADQTLSREDVEGFCRSLVGVQADLAPWSDAD